MHHALQDTPPPTRAVDDMCGSPAWLPVPARPLLLFVRSSCAAIVER
jgi:hypothetical protein